MAVTGRLSTIIGGGEKSVLEYSEDFGEIQLPSELQTGTLFTFASQGKLFISSSVSNIGIWILDRETETIVKVFSTGYYWDGWFEDSQGNIFVSSGSTTAGYNGKWDGTTFVRVYSPNETRWNIWFEDSQGNVFVSNSTNNYSGILKWNGTAFNKVYNGYNRWNGWFEDSQGNVFVGGTEIGSGIIKWNGTTFVQVFSHERGYIYWFEDSKGNVFVSSSISSTGIWQWDGTTFVQVYNESYHWRVWFEDSKGNVFVSSTYDSNKTNNIVRFNGTNFVSAFQSTSVTRSMYGAFFEDSQGNVFAGCTENNTNGLYGLLKWDGSRYFVKVYDPQNNWVHFQETSDGITLVSSGNPSINSLYKVILMWQGTTFVQVFPGYLYNQSIDNMLISGVTDSIYPILDKDSLMPISMGSGTMVGDYLYNITSIYKLTKKAPVEVYTSKYSVPTSLVVVVDKQNTVFQICPKSIIYTK